MASQARKGEETKERSGKSAERKDAPIQEIETREKKKSWSLGTQKLGSYAKGLFTGLKNTIQNQFVESNNTTQDSIQQQKNEKQTYSQEDEEDEEEEEFDDEGAEEEEEDDEGDEGEEEEDDEESEGYEEDEGSLEDEQEEEATAPVKAAMKIETEKRGSIDNFAIDDDESPPIQHPSSGSLEDKVEEAKHNEENAEKPRKKKSKKGKGKKGKGKKKGGAKPKQQSDNLTFEDVYVNKTYAYGSLFTEFHQFYFKGDYLDFEPEDFFRAVFVNEKTAISNLLFNEVRYLNVQDGVFYVTKLETVENYKLALVLESFPLSRMVRLDKVDKKKRIDIAFYTEEGGQNVQRELVYEVRNYQKFLKVLNQSLSTTNSSVHILSFNIE